MTREERRERIKQLGILRRNMYIALIALGLIYALSDPLILLILWLLGE